MLLPAVVRLPGCCSIMASGCCWPLAARADSGRWAVRPSRPCYGSMSARQICDGASSHRRREPQSTDCGCRTGPVGRADPRSGGFLPVHRRPTRPPVAAGSALRRSIKSALGTGGWPATPDAALVNTRQAGRFCRPKLPDARTALPAVTPGLDGRLGWVDSRVGWAGRVGWTRPRPGWLLGWVDSRAG